MNEALECSAANYVKRFCESLADPDILVVCQKNHFWASHGSMSKAAILAAVHASAKLAKAVRDFLNADRSEHLRTRFSDDENDKFDKIIEALGPVNVLLAGLVIDESKAKA